MSESSFQQISIIIPTYNEAAKIEEIIEYLNSSLNKEKIKEIIVVDAESADNTYSLAKNTEAKVVSYSKRNRAAQLNKGAQIATGDILYFLHADSTPPRLFINDISDAVNKGYDCGCYRLAFDYDSPLLNFICWFTRFNINPFRYGDQSLFIKRSCFEKIGGYDESLQVMEDNDIVKRIKKQFRFIVLKKAITTSARKYLKNGIFRLNAIFFLIYFMYIFGFSQKSLMKIYRALIK